MLLQGNCVQLYTDETEGEIEAKAGESLLIRRIETYQATGDTYITLKTDRVTTGVYRIKGRSGNHIETVHTAVVKFNLMEFLAQKGINVALPVAEGQTFSFVVDTAVDAILVVFDRYSAGDMLKTAPNGSEAKEYTFMQYMNISTEPADAINGHFDTSLSPKEFPGFPCAEVVPARHSISLLGLIGCAWCDGQATDKGYYTTHIKLIKDREVLFDPERNGIPFQSYYISGSSGIYGADWSLIGGGSRFSGAIGVPLMFDPPLEFVSGEELNVYAVCTAYGTDPGWTVAVPDLAAILKVVKE